MTCCQPRVVAPEPAHDGGSPRGVEAAADALVSLLSTPRGEMARECRAAASSYRWGLVGDAWHELLLTVAPTPMMERTSAIRAS